MRVISGKARRILLETPKGNFVRPTTDRIKETLFNILTPYIEGSNFLDLFSGSGAIGIEALSRGAKKAYFVDNHKESVECIKNNLNKTHLYNQAEVISYDVFQALNMLKLKGECFDLIFMDPPYNKNIEKEVLKYLSKSSLINLSSIIILECDNRTSFDYLDEYNFTIYKTKKYKTNQHLYIKQI